MRRSVSLPVAVILLAAFLAPPYISLSRNMTAPKKTTALPDKYMYSIHRQGAAESFLIVV